MNFVLCLLAVSAFAKAPTKLEIVEVYRCPLPPHTGVMTLEPSGEATLFVEGGFDPGAGTGTSQKKHLSAKQMKELARVVRHSKWLKIPDTVYDILKPPKRTDGCSQSIQIELEGKSRTISYNSGYENPPALDSLLKNIHAVLDHDDWVEDRPISRKKAAK